MAEMYIFVMRLALRGLKNMLNLTCLKLYFSIDCVIILVEGKVSGVEGNKQFRKMKYNQKKGEQ